MGLGVFLFKLFVCLGGAVTPSIIVVDLGFTFHLLVELFVGSGGGGGSSLFSRVLGWGGGLCMGVTLSVSWVVMRIQVGAYRVYLLKDVLHGNHRNNLLFLPCSSLAPSSRCNPESVG